MKILFCALGLAAAAPRAFGQDPFLHGLYDKLHDSPAQRRFRALAPMPFGVVFLPWKGITEAEIRRHYRLMKQLGFHNLKQVMPTPEWSEQRLLELALDEDVIPFWYGEGGWEPITPELLARLGIPAQTPLAALRAHPKMRAYQKEVLRRGIAAGNQAVHIENSGTGAFRFTPDPYLYDHDVPHFQKWLRSAYRSPEEVADAWNQYEVGIEATPVRSWEDVDRAVVSLSREGRGLRGHGREYGRIRDILRYKADFHTEEIRRRTEMQRKVNGNPWAPTRTGGEMGLFLPFAWRATRMEDLAQTQVDSGSFYPSIHMAWHYGEVHYEVARTVYMQASFANDLFKGGWTATWESTGGPQQLTGAKGWDYPEQSTTPGFTIHAGTMSQLLLSYLAGGLRGVGIWSWTYRRAGWEGGEYALLDRNLQPGARAIRAGKIAQAAERFRDELWAAHKEPLIGVLVNWDNDAIWAAIAVRGRDHFKHYPMQARVGVSRALINANVPWEYVTVDDLRAGLAGRYKVIYLAGQLAMSDSVWRLLLEYARSGGRVVLDSPGAAYDEYGKVLPTIAGSTFEQLFGAELADLQYSNNVPRFLGGVRLNGFIHELKPTRAEVLRRFQTGEPAVTVAETGKGRGVILAWDASFALFRPGHEELERLLVHYALGGLESPYSCDGAVVYRLAAPAADHYFFINDDEPKTVHLRVKQHRYAGGEDPVSGEALSPGGPIALEGYSARWVRLRHAQ